MKQTNNAIKFLMAQYRAIFRNANLKMFLAAATAAAAMAAGQAQAAPVAGWNDLKNPATETVIDGTNKNLAIKGGTVANATGFKLNITGGTNSIEGNGTDAAGVFTVKGEAPSSFTMNFASAQAATDLTIGAKAAHKNAKVTIGSFANNNGILTIAGNDGSSTSELNANTITIGSDSSTKADVNVNEFASLNAIGESGSLTIAKGATVTLEANASVTGKTINVTDGKVSLSGAAATTKFGSNTSAITITGGTVEAATGKSGSVIGSSIVLSGGNLTGTGALVIDSTGTGDGFKAEKGTITSAATGTVTFKGKTAISGTTEVSAAGVLAFEGDATIADTATVKDVAGATTKLHIGDASLTLSSANLAKFVAGAEIASLNNKKATIVLNDQTKIALGTAKIVAADGQVDAKFKKQGTGTLTIMGTEAEFAGADALKGNDGVTLSFDTITLGKGADFTIQKGGLTVGKSLTIKDNKALTLDSGNSLTLSGASGTISAKSVTVGSSAQAADLVVKSGNWEITDLTLTKNTDGKSSVDSGAALTIKGTLTTTADSKLTVNGNLSTVGEGSFNFATAGVGSITLGSTGKFTVDAKDILASDGAGKTLNNAVYKSGAVKGAGSTIVIEGLQKDQFASKTEFESFYTSTGYDGTFDMGDAVKLEIAEGPIKLADTVNGLTTDAYKDKTLQVETGDTLTKNIVVGNVLISGDQDNFDIGQGGKLTLNTADGKGNLITKGEAAAGVNFKDTAATLILKGAGNIGNIISDGPNKGVLNVDAVKGATVTVVKGANIGDQTNTVSEVNVNNGSILNVESGSIFANNLNINDGSTVKVTGDIETTDIQVDGNLEATGALVVSTAGQNNFSSANVKVGSLKLANGVKVNIGHYDVDVPENDATGSVYASSLDLNSGSVFIDPNTNMPYSVLAVNTLKGGVVDGVNAGTLTGTVNVGNNGVFGVGFESTAQLNSYLAKYTNQHGGLDPEQFSSALVLNKQITLGATDGLYVGKDATSASATANKLTFKSDAALVVSDDVFTVVGGKKTGSAITTDNGATVDVTDAKLVLIGDFSAADDALQIISGSTSAVTVTGQFKLGSANGLLAGEAVGANGTYRLTFDKDAAINKGAFADASAPVREALFGKLAGTLKGDGLGFDLISDVATSTLSGAVADAAAHAATYAGAQQAAVAAVGTMAEAVGGRVGSMGVEAATITATGTQATGGVWVSPMYKSVDADGFNAQGASYGAEIDLAGVAFGADTVEGNSRYGVVFNIGSGDSDGKGNGQGLKDDFDYYGIGIYSARAAGNFAVVADASLNVISHDVEGLGLKGSAETMAFTAGLTGQYTMSSPMVDVTPHLGARLIRLDTDSYDLTSADGVVATTDFDVQNVFSVPLGVTLSKAFEMDGWSLAPSADLTIAFNAGDTEAESTTRFSGVDRNIGLSTEVLDEVTYGVAVGLGAQYGAFGTQIGLNYTGSSNTDSFGVNAQARYMF